MEDDVKVRAETKEIYNLSYVLTKNRDSRAFEGLMKLYEDSPAFKNTETYRMIEAGRKQAEAELENELFEMRKDYLNGAHAENKSDITDNPYDGHDEWVDQVEQHQQRESEYHHPKEDKPFAEEHLNRAQGPEIPLTEKQIRELNKFEADQQAHEERKAFKDTSRRITGEGHNNSDFVEHGEAQSFDNKPEEKTLTDKAKEAYEAKLKEISERFSKKKDKDRER